MISLKDLKEECKSIGCNLVVRSFASSMLFSVEDKMVVASQDWADNLEEDDNVFHILVKIGECCFYQYSDDEDERHGGALTYAIETAEKYSLKISSAKKNEILNEISKNKGSQFDPKIADVFLDILKNDFNSVREIQEKY